MVIAIAFADALHTDNIHKALLHTAQGTAHNMFVHPHILKRAAE